MEDTPTPQWEHEDGSVMLIDWLYEKNEEKINQNTGLDKQDFNLIKDLIKGESRKYSAHMPEKMFLFDIVANKRNSFDVDKLDYINRDLKHTQVNSS